MLQPHAYIVRSHPIRAVRHHWQHIRHNLVVGHGDDCPSHDLMRLLPGAGWPYMFATGFGITTRAQLRSMCGSHQCCAKLPIKCHLPDCKYVLRSFRFHDDRIRGCCRRAAEEGYRRFQRQDTRFCSIHGRARVYTSVNATAEIVSTRGRFASTSPVKLRRKDLRK